MQEQKTMTKRKKARGSRSLTGSAMINRAFGIGRTAIRQAGRRMPPDLRQQVERIVTVATERWETELDRAVRAAAVRGEDLAVSLERFGGQVRKLSRRLAEQGTTTKPAVRPRPARAKAKAGRAKASQARVARVARASSPRPAPRKPTGVRTPAAPVETPSAPVKTPAAPVEVPIA